MTIRLVRMALDNWQDIDGWAVGHGVGDLGRLELDRFVNFVWWWATRDAEQKDRDKFESHLWMPPPGEEGRGVWSAEAEMAGFSALKEALNK